MRPLETHVQPRKKSVARRDTKRNHNVLLTVVENADWKRNKWLKVQNPDMMPSENPTMDSDENLVANCPGINKDDESSIKMNQANWLSQEQLRKVASSGDYWHKFIILRGAGYSKLEIMHALFESVQNQVLAPVMYHRDGSSTCFLARNCLGALERFAAIQSLQLQVHINGVMGPTTQVLDMEIILRHTHVRDLRLHLHDHLAACIARRHDKTLRVIDLSAFHQDPELSDVVFWALWSPKAFSYVINMLKGRVIGIRCLILADNELVDLPKMDVLTKLEVVDISSNKIARMSVLKAFQGLKIVDITLDRNPVCSTYEDEKCYIESVKDYLPYVKKIDGVHLTRAELPVWRRHYVPPGQSECVTLVDQFLQHYFTLLDGDDRQRLRGMYHPDALFSLTCNYVPGQVTSSTARLTRYTLESRNLLRLSDYSKSQQLLSRGAEEVLAALCRLPRTEHDPYSFAVDLPYYTQDTAVIVVSGIFRETSIMAEKVVRAFSRTFVLHKVASKEYQIANEMLSVSNASTKQFDESFQYPKPKVSLAKLSFNPAQDLTDADRQQMTRILSRLTEMNQRWARKYLDESKWDIKEALIVFTELLKMNKLPGEAFDLEEDQVVEKK